MAKQQTERTVRIPERFVDGNIVKQVGAEAACVFMIIVRYARWTGDNQGEAWPTYDTIHHHTGFHRHTIAMAVKTLERCGYIHVTLKKRVNKEGVEFGRMRNHYLVSHLRKPVEPKNHENNGSRDGH